MVVLAAALVEIFVNPFSPCSVKQRLFSEENGRGSCSSVFPDVIMTTSNSRKLLYLALLLSACVVFLYLFWLRGLSDLHCTWSPGGMAIQRFVERLEEP